LSSARVILHVGAPKTGTTYVQQILWGQREQLLRDRIWLPGRTARAHDALMGRVRGGVWLRPDSPWTWERLARRAAGRPETALVSNEHLAGATPRQIAPAMAALDGADVRVVIGCRALSSSLPSTWQQLMKSRSTVRFGDWLDTVTSDPGHGFFRHQDPVSIARRWAAELPAASVHVVTMPASSSDPLLLWRRFAAAIGVDPAGYAAPAGVSNESIGAVEAEFLRRVNAGLGDRLPLLEPYRLGVRRTLVRTILQSTGPRRRFGVPARHAAWVEDRSARMIEELGNHPCTVHGDLEDLAPRLDPNAASPDDVTDAEVAELGVRLMADLLARQMDRASVVR